MVKKSIVHVFIRCRPASWVSTSIPPLTPRLQDASQIKSQSRMQNVHSLVIAPPNTQAQQQPQHPTRRLSAALPQTPSS